MALMRVQLWAQSLQKQTNMTVILPEVADPAGPYPTLYLLHGLSDDDTIWTRRTSLERYVSAMPLVVVMPDGGRGFYTDAREGYAFESHVMRDVMGFVERCFPVVRARKGRAIGGLSMGGFGAMKLALKHPRVFASVVAHSSAFDMRSRIESADLGVELHRIFGDDPAEGDNDIFLLAERAKKAGLPAIRFDCGDEDFLIEDNRRFHAHLERLGIAHEYAEFPGTHEWGYWDEHVQEALRFHAAALGIAGAA